ncbi:MAG: dephospho-CoA kinase [Phycisphaerales bacterium]
MTAPARPPETSDVVAIGVTGAVGSGKSAAAGALEALGCARFDADRSAKAALDRPEVVDALREWWGDDVVGEGGRIDRARIAAIVFADDAQRRRLEGLIHPIVREDLTKAMRNASAAGVRCIALDIPLLHEGGLDAWCDAVLFIDTPRDQRLARVRASRGWSDEELARREAAQMPEAEKRRCATVVVRNDADLETLRTRIGEAFGALCRAG